MTRNLLTNREKGGYTRSVVEVHCEPQPGDTYVPGEIVQALLYSGTTDNPNFWLAPTDEAAAVIAKAVGPSGSSVDYLFSLAEYLRCVCSSAILSPLAYVVVVVSENIVFI
jgi:cation transport regulator ChaC